MLSFFNLLLAILKNFKPLDQCRCDIEEKYMCVSSSCGDSSSSSHAWFIPVGLETRDLWHWAGVGGTAAVCLPFYVRKPHFKSPTEQSSCSYFLEKHFGVAGSCGAMPATSLFCGCSEMGRFGEMGFQQAPKTVMPTSKISPERGQLWRPVKCSASS